jgi:hypothetical protein
MLTVNMHAISREIKDKVERKLREDIKERVAGTRERTVND